jgi:hypothetical protein
MFLLKFQNSSAFEPLKIAQLLALRKKIDYMDQSDLKIFRRSRTSMNLHKLNCPMFADPSRSQLQKSHR